MKITIVVQRYGETIVGGSEAYARTIAFLLAQWHEVTILTSTAHDHNTWREHFPAGETADGPIRVLRFSAERERSVYWQELNRILHTGLGGNAFSVLSPSAKEAFLRRLEKWPCGLQEEYIRWQGPYTPGLFSWLQENHPVQDRFLFITYLYPTTYFGLPCVPSEKADFIPTLHDEPPAYLPSFARSFSHPSRLLFLTQVEMRLARRLYNTPVGRGQILGYGIQEAAQVEAPVALDPDPFLLYAGRIEVNKGVQTLLEYFLRWKEEHPRSPLRLILIGHSSMELPKHPSISYLGFVSEEDKNALIRQALTLIQPSPFESLGLILLEAFLGGTPALVCQQSEVLVEHCRQSNGGLWYGNYLEFSEALSWLVGHPQETVRLGAQGRAYAQSHYSMTSYLKCLTALYPPQ